MRWPSHEAINSFGVVVAVALGGSSLAMSWSEYQAKAENIVLQVSPVGGDYDTQITGWVIGRRYNIVLTNVSELDTSIVSIRASYGDPSMSFVLDQAFFSHRPFEPINVAAGSSVSVMVTLPFPIMQDCQFAEIGDLPRPVGVAALRAIFGKHNKLFPGCVENRSPAEGEWADWIAKPTDYVVVAQTGRGFTAASPTYFWSQ